MIVPIMRYLKLFIFFYVIWLFSSPGLCFANPLMLGTRPLGFAGAYTGLADDNYSTTLNPAGISLYPRYHVLAYYTYSNLDNTYEVGSIIADSKTSQIGMSIAYINRGFLPIFRDGDIFSRSITSITHNYWALTLSENYRGYFLIGLNLELHSMRSSLGNDDTFTFDAGVLVPLGDYFRIGAVVHNAASYGRDRLIYTNDPRRRSISLGAEFHYKDIVSVQVDWNRDLEDLTGNHHRIAVGAFAVGRKYFEIRAGYARDFFYRTNEIGAGFTFRAPRFGLEYSYFIRKFPSMKDEERHSVSVAVYL